MSPIGRCQGDAADRSLRALLTANLLHDATRVKVTRSRKRPRATLAYAWQMRSEESVEPAPGRLASQPTADGPTRTMLISQRRRAGYLQSLRRAVALKRDVAG